MGKKIKRDRSGDKEQTRTYGDPEYDAREDIYSKGEKSEDYDLDGEEEIFPGKTKSIETDLDIPGSEQDDADEVIGEEDEENNYYSLGGDDHNDLEEDQPE